MEANRGTGRGGKEEVRGAISGGKEEVRGESGREEEVGETVASDGAATAGKSAADQQIRVGGLAGD